MKSNRSNDARKLSSSEKQALRKRAVEQVAKGESPETVADTLGINHRTIYRWIERYRHGGVDGLTARHKSGRPPKFTSEDLRWLSQTIPGGDPRQLQLPFALWTRAIVRDLLRRERGLRVSDVTVGRMLKKSWV